MGLNFFQKLLMHALLCDLKSRLNKGGSVVMATAAASAGFFYEESVQAAAALESVRVAATAYLDMPGALAAGVSGAGAVTDLLDAMFSLGMGKPAAAATDLLDAPNSECMKEFFGSATFVLGDNGGLSNSMWLGTLSAVAAANSIDFRCIESAKGHCQCPGRHLQHCVQRTS